MSNPPYVSKKVFESLPPEYHAEPDHALVSGLGGLELPLEILLRAPEYLQADGVLICEVGENAQLLADSLPSLPLTWPILETGGEGVFTISREQLLNQHSDIGALLEKLRNVA